MGLIKYNFVHSFSQINATHQKKFYDKTKKRIHLLKFIFLLIKLW